VWGLGHTNYEGTPDWESYDWIINLENYDSVGWVPSLSNVKNPKKFLWSIDAHCRGEPVYEHTFYEGNYDVLLHSTKDFVTKDYHRWFPNAFDDTLIIPLEIEKRHKLGFCGNYVNRHSILKHLEETYGLHLDIFVIGDNMVKTVNGYVCHFNMNIGNDINYRSFETIGCGTLLLTNYNPQYDELGFVDGENCLMYRNMDELNRKIRLVLDDDVSSLSDRGYQLSKRHTYVVRTKELLESCT
jgi:hypothetical protein